jgi:disulfide oxidoreductase YuzD
MAQLMALRRDCATFLEQIYHRENLFEQIQQMVNNIKNDDFFYPAEGETDADIEITDSNNLHSLTPRQ